MSNIVNDKKRMLELWTLVVNDVPLELRDLNGIWIDSGINDNDDKSPNVCTISRSVEYRVKVDKKKEAFNNAVSDWDPSISLSSHNKRLAAFMFEAGYDLSREDIKSMIVDESKGDLESAFEETLKALEGTIVPIKQINTLTVGSSVRAIVEIARLMFLAGDVYGSKRDRD